MAGLAFLTLLPAMRRGPSYLLDNGSLVVLALAVLISLGKAGVLTRWLETRRSDSAG